MCRNIRTLFNFDPPATEEEVRAASLQFVRKVSGMTKPAAANTESFDTAVEDIAAAAQRLLESLQTTSPPKNREAEAARARTRAAQRYGTRLPLEAPDEAGSDLSPRPAANGPG